MTKKRILPSLFLAATQFLFGCFGKDIATPKNYAWPKIDRGDECPNLSGNYHYTSDSVNCAEGQYTGKVKHPLNLRFFGSLEFKVIQNGCSFVEVGYDRDGTWRSFLKVQVGKDGVEWKDGKLLKVIARKGGYPIVPGVSAFYAQEYLARGKDGNLLHEWGYGQRGLTLFVFPFSDYSAGRCIYEHIP